MVRDDPTPFEDSGRATRLWVPVDLFDSTGRIAKQTAEREHTDPNHQANGHGEYRKAVLQLIQNCHRQREQRKKLKQISDLLFHRDLSFLWFE